MGCKAVIHQFNISAQTFYNSHKIIQGQSNNGNDFTELGYIHSRLLAKRLSNVKFDEIISSDLNRTRETTKEILQENVHTNSFGDNVKFDKILREKSFGIFEEKQSKVYYGLLETKKIPERLFRPINGENNVDLFIRAKKFLLSLITTNVKSDFIEKMNKQMENKIEKRIEELKLKLSLNEINNFEFNDMEKFMKDQLNFLIESGEMNYKSYHDYQPESLTDLNLKSQTLDKPAIDDYLNNINLDYLNVTPYLGFNNDNNMKRILVVSHSGFIRELIHVIYKLKGLKFQKISSTNTALYVIRIYCKKCGTICLEQACEENNLEYDFLLFNDTFHLQILNNQ